MYWTNQRAAQACAQQAQGPTVFGLGQRAWHEAGQHFQEAADAERTQDNAKAEHFRTLGSKRLRDAGLSLNMTLPQAMRERVEPMRTPEDTQEMPLVRPYAAQRPSPPKETDLFPPRREVPPRPPEMFNAMMHVCAERALRLRNAAARMTGADALACAAYLGAAGVMERAATEWLNRNSVGANSFSVAAERLLEGAMIAVPWKRPVPQQEQGR